MDPKNSIRVGVWDLTTVISQRILQRVTRTSLDPRDPIVSRGGPVFLRKPIATCNFEINVCFVWTSVQSMWHDNLIKIPISLEEKWQTIFNGKFHRKHLKVHKRDKDVKHRSNLWYSKGGESVVVESLIVADSNVCGGCEGFVLGHCCIIFLV